MKTILKFLFVLMFPLQVFSGGFIITNGVPQGSTQQGQKFYTLECRSLQVRTSIQDQAAVTTVEQVFYNNTDQRLEGYFMFPIPKGCVIKDFRMEINGVMMQAEMLDATKARQIYEDIVRRMKDPALLEYAEQDLFRLRIFPIEPKSEKKISISYTELLPKDNGTYAYQFPLNTKKYSAAPLQNVTIQVDVQASGDIKTIYSPSHEVEIIRKSSHESKMGYESHQVSPDMDFQLYYNTSSSILGTSFLTYKQAEESFIKNGNNRVVLATDGDFNVGVSSDDELVKLIEEKRKSGVFLTVLGYGMGNYKDAKMEKLADKGNGNYVYIDTQQEAEKVLVTEFAGTMHAIAKDVKLQLEFNPSIVKSYRLIGYENRQLQDWEFNDDTRDAGELGAGHTVTAIYEVELYETPLTSGLNDSLKYQVTDLSKAAASNEILTIKFRYKLPKEDKSKLIEQVLMNTDHKFTDATENLRFAAAVAGFGMMLRDSEYKGNLTYDKVMDMGKDSRGKDEDGYRSEFVQLVKATRNLK